MKTILISFLLTIASIFLIAQQSLFVPPAITGNQIDLHLQKGTVNFLPGTPTQTMGANGNLLGPTIIIYKDDTVAINVTNDLGEPTTLHWHGLHVSPENDGGPHIVIEAGETWSPVIPVLDDASTAWYHPHLHMKTNEHVQKGLAGFIIVKDDIESTLNLPREYGVDDFPLVVQTKAFDQNNQIIIESALDSFPMVNGTLDPYLDAPPQIIRLRLLNGSSERAYNFGFEGNKEFFIIASDGGLLEEAVSANRLQVFPGERYEILIDLAPFTGQSFDMMSYGSGLPNAIYGAAQPGMGPNQTIPNYANNPLNGNDFPVLSINVTNQQTANAVTSIPQSLIQLQPYLESDADTTRMLTFTVAGGGMGGMSPLEGPFHINGVMFDMDVINMHIPFENIEIWELVNQTPIGHPFHIHDVEFYILDINGSPPPTHLRGKKDVVFVPGGMGSVRFITQFKTFYNDTLPYMYHCHMLTHEDHGMMGQFVVMSPKSTSIVEQKELTTDFLLYPNPAQNKLFLETTNSDNIHYLLYDITGRIIQQKVLSYSSDFIDIQSLRPGIYFIQFPQTGYVEKFIKK